MPRDPDRYDFFVSYARADNRAGWITAFVEEILAAHVKFTGGWKLTHFFDKNDIRSFDDWQHSLNDGLQHSRLFLAFISLASGPGTDLKMFATGLAAGILLDATVIRALLVPAVVSLFGRWNWILPRRPARLLRVEPSLPPRVAASQGEAR